jgi:hypothetical protein
MPSSMAFWAAGLGLLDLVGILHEQSIPVGHHHVPAWARVLFRGLLVAGLVALSWGTCGERTVISSSCRVSLSWKTCGGQGVLESKPKPIVGGFTHIQILVN